jgi:hypothetical protein
MATNKEELLEQWLVETDPSRRKLMFNELTLRGLFPDDTDFDDAYGLYPSVEDDKFLMKLFHKREFAENKYESIDDLATCEGRVEFEVSPVQRFVSTYLSGKTPYTSALLYHGVGTGKTCAAISITEAFLHIFSRKKVYIIAPPNIQPNFVRTIFDINNVTISEEINSPNQHRGCTGNLYLQLTGTEYEKDRKVIEKKVKTLISSRYQFMGYIQLAKHIERSVSKIPSFIKDPEKRRLEEIKIIRNEFSGSCMIIDEAHNLRDIPGEKEEENLDAPGGIVELTDAQEGKKLTPSLTRVLNFALNMKLVLLTATPMYNNYQEIIFLLNLLLKNDKRGEMKISDIFTQKGDFIPEGRSIFGKVVKAYVSYMRGETPISFPIRLNPHRAPKLEVWPSLMMNNQAVELNDSDKERLLRLPIVPVKYGDETYATYVKVVEDSVEQYGLGVNSIDTIVQSGNWIYPAVDEDIGIESRIRDVGFDNAFDDKAHSIRNFTRFSSKLGPPKWLIDTNLVNYSPKSAFIIKNIRKSRGPVFVYSRFIKSGALPLALALEANGYTPYGRDRGLLYDGTQLETGLQCALCEAREKEHKTSSHTFTPAKYVLLTGRKDISPNNNDAVISERASTNYNGADIKVIIGSQVASEGIDLKFIREIYVVDSWFHLNKMEQVLGRGIRTCSHVHPKIPKDQRNTTIYLLVNTLSNKESADMYMYRLGMMKALQMGKVTRVIKQHALDCNLNISVNVIQGLPISNQTDAQGHSYEVNINDQNYTNMCDWMECKYTCSEPIDIDIDKTSTLTYDEYDARWRESEIKKVIKKLFETREKDEGELLMRAEDLIDNFSAIPIEALYSILHDIVNNKSFRLVVNKKEGYLTYKNGFYLFQPIKINYDDIPLAMRIANYPVKLDEFSPLKEKVKVEEAIVPVTEEISDEKNFIQKFWETILLMAKKIQVGSLELKIQQSVLDVLRKKFPIKSVQSSTAESLESIIWLYKTMKDNVDYRSILSYVFLGYVWDNLLTTQEQFILSNKGDDVTAKVAEEQIIQDGKYFRFLNYSDPYDIQYYCGNKLCFEAEKRILDKDARDSYNVLPPANIKNVGPIYGFMVPKSKQVTFKTNTPAQVGANPKGGNECKINTATKEHLMFLYSVGKILKESHIHDFDLNEDAINPDGGPRKIRNVNTYCTIKEYILRWMDMKKVRNLRWFYRPISSYKTGHRGRVTKSKD